MKSSMAKTFNTLQIMAMDMSKQIGKEIDATVYHTFMQENEDDIEYVFGLYVAAPCGCCGIKPIISLDDTGGVRKLKFLKDVHDIVKEKVSEYRHMYAPDYSRQYSYDKDILFSKTVEEVAKDFCIDYIKSRKEYWDDEDIDSDDCDKDGNITYGVVDYSYEKYGC